MTQNQQSENKPVCTRAQGESKTTSNNDRYEPKAKAFEAGLKRGKDIEEIKNYRRESSNINTGQAGFVQGISNSKTKNYEPCSKTIFNSKNTD